MWKRALTMLILYGQVGPLFAGQATANQETPTIRTTTREVILDVIVRDKHHHAIADLRPDEIEVFEDGVKQKVNAFRNVQGAEQLHTEQGQAKTKAPVPSPGAPETPATALRELNFVSVVFAQIAPLNLEFAHQAVLEFLKSGSLPNTYVTIYRLDRALKLIQPYTADKTSLMSAVNAAAKGVNTGSAMSTSATVASSVDTAIQATTTNIIASPFTGQAAAIAAQSAALNPLPGIVTDPLWARNAAAQDASVALNSALLVQSHIATGLRFAESLSHGCSGFAPGIGTSSGKTPGQKSRSVLSGRIDFTDGSPRRSEQRNQLRQSDGSVVLRCRYARVKH
jgi:VWFA-related protein